MTPEEFHHKVPHSKDRNPYWVEFGRLALIKFFAECGCKTGAEVGVHEGGHAKLFLDWIEGPIYLVDPYKHFPDSIYGEGNNTNPQQEISNRRFENVKKRFKDSNAIIIRKESIEALADIDNESLDFVYIDANHNPAFVWCDLRGWWPKLKSGGIMSGHDIWLEDVGRNVAMPVRMFVKEKGVKYWYETTGPGREWFFLKGK